MNIEFLQILLAAWPEDEAVRVCDAQGQTVAQNGRALEVVAQGYAPANACGGDFWRQPHVRERDLLSGWQLQARPAPAPSAHGSAEESDHKRRKSDLLGDLSLGGLPPAERRAQPTASHFPDVTSAKPLISSTGRDKPIEVQTLSRGVVHELRNPLAAIVTAAGLLQDDPSASEETLMLLGVIRKESHRMNRILTEFSAYVKPRPPQPAPFDLSGAVRQEARGLLKEIGQSEPVVEVEDLMPPHLLVLADEEHLREVVRHVLRNALEAMQGGGSLQLEADPEEGTVLLRLSDSGPGLSPEALERAFQPFFSSKSQSTGLGLSIARTAVEASGGRIWIENIAPETQNSHSTSSRQDRSRGARVFIELPLALASVAEEASATEA